MNSRIIAIICLTITFALSAGQLHSQSLANTDLSKINVDNISDEQIISYIRQAEGSGYTQQQLETLARQRGMSESEIIKLRRRVQQLRTSLGTTSTGQEQMTSLGNRSEPLLNESEVFGILAGGLLDTELSETESKIFGYNLFRSENLTFAPNLNIPTPKDYVLGPGDELIVDLWGATQQYFTYEVSTEGSIRPQNLSPIQVNGLTIEQARRKVIDRLSQIYAGLKSTDGQRATIFSQVSLGNIRSINVTVVGEVNNPGNYTLNSLSTVFTALYASGGPTEQGTFRSIRLIRNNKLKSEIDLYDFLVDGIKTGDEILRAGDIIVVRPFETRVEVEGEMKRSGIFELRENETFSDLVKFSGGFSSKAYRAMVGVKRAGDREMQALDIAANDFDSFELQDGDLLTVDRILDRFSNRVQIEGAVFRSGEYQLTDGLTMKALIERADGLKGDAYMERATIYRLNDDLSQVAIPVDLQALMDGSISDIPLVKEDIIRVSSIYDLKEEYYVEVIGEVQDAGVYPFFSQMTVEDLIVIAGGLREGALESVIEISRRNQSSNSTSTAEIVTIQVDKDLSLNSGDGDPFLKPFDQVYVRRTPGYTVQQQVSIEGEVAVPGKYTITRKDERVSDIVKRAQGLTPYAYPQGAILVRKTEFAKKKSDGQITFANLEKLRSKILEDTTAAMNLARTELIERLNNIQRRIENDSQEDVVGSRIKRELTQDIANTDSLNSQTELELSEDEPTILELVKIMENPGSEYDFILREGDVISIPSKLETVRVAGEVISPLNVRYDRSFSFKDYINDAGGFTATAKKGRSYVQYPNGRRKQTKRFLFFKFYPEVEPGSTIFVSRKPDRQPLNFQAIIAAAGSVATLALVIDRLSTTN